MSKDYNLRVRGVQNSLRKRKGEKGERERSMGDDGFKPSGSAKKLKVKNQHQSSNQNAKGKSVEGSCSEIWKLRPTAVVLSILFQNKNNSSLQATFTVFWYFFFFVLYFPFTSLFDYVWYQTEKLSIDFGHEQLFPIFLSEEYGYRPFQLFFWIRSIAPIKMKCTLPIVPAEQGSGL